MRGLRRRCNVLIAGDDFKSGQTKVKSVLVDFLVRVSLFIVPNLTLDVSIKCRCKWYCY